LTQVTDPSAGMTTQGYDAVGNVVSIVRPNGVTTQMTYDSRNRVTSITERDPSNAILAAESYTLDALGNRTLVTRNDGSNVQYQYDSLGRVTKEKHLNASNSVTFESVYAYNAAGKSRHRRHACGAHNLHVQRR